jgi:hypothetical protein
MSGSILARMHAVDRMVSALGGRAFIHGRPRMGWLAIEMVPALLWSQVTGSLTMDYYYFVAFLTILGASDASLAWLPLATYASGVLQVFIVLRRDPADPKRICVRDALLARIAWLGTILWPIIGLHFGWGSTTILAGVSVSIFVSMIIHYSSGAMFMVWTQAIVPRDLRGHFYAWRNVVTFTLVPLTLYGISCVLPQHGGATEHAQLLWLIGLLGAATLVGIIGVWPLALSPEMPESARLREHPPLLPQLRSNQPLRRLMGWMLFHCASLAASAAYVPKLFIDAGVHPGLMAEWQALAFYPGMLVAVVVSGWAMRRIGGSSLVVAAHLGLIASDALLLVLTPENLMWMLPLVLLLSGLAKGAFAVSVIARMQEVIPAGDPRFASLITAAGSLGGVIAAASAFAMVPTLESAHGTGVIAGSVSWLMVLAGVLLRIAGTPFLLRPGRDQRVLIAVQASS